MLTPPLAQCIEEQLSAIDALERAERRSASLRRAVLKRAVRGECGPERIEQRIVAYSAATVVFYAAMRRQPPLLLPLFRSDGQARLLARVYLFPDRLRPLADLARELGIDRGTLTREADRLEQAGLVRSERIGRQRILHANTDSLYFSELNSLLLKALGPANLIGPAVAELSNVDNAFLIGSWAARYLGQAGPPPGDVDLLLIGSPEWGAVSRMARELSSILGQEVNPTILSPEQWADETDGFVRQVRREPRLELPLDGAPNEGVA